MNLVGVNHMATKLGAMQNLFGISVEKHTAQQTVVHLSLLASVVQKQMREYIPKIKREGGHLRERGRERERERILRAETQC